MPELTRETWLPVAGYEEIYEVSDQGRVRGLDRVLGDGRFRRGGIRSLTVDDGGYLALDLWRDGKPAKRRVHDLVAEAFSGPRPPGQVARHLNDVKSDNRWPENLAWGTHQENQLDAVANGRNANVAKEACPAGHPYEGRNLIVAKRRNGRTFRQCRTCLYRVIAERRAARA